ncbi:MAG: DUF839 domain-containing protein [Thauera sp.]|nr:DUF839 domain-containing protein [Thauera sp.]
MTDPRFHASRRNMLKGTASLAAAPFVTTFGLMARNAEAATCERFTEMTVSPFGPLAPMKDETTGLELLQLPEGFSYRTIGWQDDIMSDGITCPARFDGMAVVSQRREGRSTELILVRNHEVGNFPRTTGVAPTYDSAANSSGNYAGGGTTTIVLRDGVVVDVRASLAGTMTNCAGGPTPWGTWLSCEENTDDRSAFGGKKHGYVFEVDPDPAQTTAEPLVAMGRFRHEAVAIDPTNNFCYQTEDQSPVSALYRFEPNNAGGYTGAYADGGRLTAARIQRIERAGTTSLADANALAFASPCLGDEYLLEWVELDNPDAAPTTRNVNGTNRSVSGTFAQAWDAGCARMARGEGIWQHGGRIYIVDTAAGGEGCLWELNPASGRIKCIYVSSNQLAGNNLDNITISPRGGIVCCEDGGTSTDEFGRGSRLFGINNQGQPFMLAKNNLNFSAEQYAAVGKNLTAGLGDQRGSEFCGACFDPLGRTLFVNIQTPGITFAITGPWAKGNL